MSTSQTTWISAPSDGEKVPKTTFAYLRTRNKRKLYSLVIKEFKKSGLTQAELARRLGRNPDVVCRWLAAPRNWEIDTVSDILFAISGAEVNYGLNYPLQAPRRNSRTIPWLRDEPARSKPTVTVKPKTAPESASSSIQATKVEFDLLESV